jgi:hypothetical protein
VRRQHTRLGDLVEHVLLGLRVGQIGIQKMLADTVGGLHQVLNPVGPDGLHDVRTNCLQQHVFSSTITTC